MAAHLAASQEGLSSVRKEVSKYINPKTSARWVAYAAGLFQRTA
jgi:hypothetical protein